MILLKKREWRLTAKPDAYKKPGKDLPRRLVRNSPRHLEIIGLRCGIQKPWEKSPCGGRLRVGDFHTKNAHGRTRYEIYCEKCNTCDPNGWARQDEILPAAREYFHALPCRMENLRCF